MSDARVDFIPTPVRDALPVSQLFSVDVRNALVRASKLPVTDHARTIAIEKATALARRTHPYLFNQEQ